MVMTKSLTVVLLILSLLILSQSNRKSDREHDRLKGPIKSVQVSFARLVPDKSGVPQEGTQEFLRSFKYDDNGMLTEKLVVEDRMKVRYLYFYDSKGNRTASVLDNNGNKVLLWFFKIDSAGNRIEERVTDDKGNVISITKYKYDAAGNLIEETFNRRSFALKKTVNSYDDKGNLQEVTQYSDSTIVKNEFYSDEFDSVGNWIKRIASVKVNKSGGKYEPVSIMYRMITYYP